MDADFEIESGMELVHQWHESLSLNIRGYHKLSRDNNHEYEVEVVENAGEDSERRFTSIYTANQIRSLYRPRNHTDIKQTSVDKTEKEDPRYCHHEWKEIYGITSIFKDCKKCHIKFEDWEANGSLPPLPRHSDDDNPYLGPLFDWDGCD